MIGMENKISISDRMKYAEMSRVQSKKRDTKIERIRLRALPILKRHGVVRAGIFGSFVRGEEKRSSDIDMLIKFGGRKSLLDLVSVEMELEGVLKRKVDLLTYNSLNPLLKNRILGEEVKIL